MLLLCKQYLFLKCPHILIYSHFTRKVPGKGKVQVKFILQQAMRAQKGSRGIALLFL